MAEITEFAASIGEYLGVEISETDYDKDFAEVGVDSLRAFGLMERLEQQYKIILLDESPYDFNTVRKLYDMIKAKVRETV